MLVSALLGGRVAEQQRLTGSPMHASSSAPSAPPTPTQMASASSASCQSSPSSIMPREEQPATAPVEPTVCSHEAAAGAGGPLPRTEENGMTEGAPQPPPPPPVPLPFFQRMMSPLSVRLGWKQQAPEPPSLPPPPLGASSSTLPDEADSHAAPAPPLAEREDAAQPIQPPAEVEQPAPISSSPDGQQGGSGVHAWTEPDSVSPGEGPAVLPDAAAEDEAHTEDLKPQAEAAGSSHLQALLHRATKKLQSERDQRSSTDGDSLLS